jgi:hypothetical protein
MSILPIEPDTNRRCFAPCRPGEFCACLGYMIPALNRGRECNNCGKEVSFGSPLPEIFCSKDCYQSFTGDYT